MITTTHIVTNALTARRWPAAFGSPRAFVAGSFAPDVGLILLTAGAAVVLPMTRDMTAQEAIQYGFDDLFFNSKLWIAGANVLHSPVVASAIALASYAASPALAGRLRSFALGVGLHIAMDIPVHVDDGPVLLWPLNWSYRFESKFSYWDPDHYGRWIAPVDMAITVLGGAYLARSFWRSRRA